MGFRPLKRKTRLLTQTQLGDQSTIALHVLLLQVSQQVAALANHLQQATTAVMVVVVGSQMLVQVVDASGQQGNLHLGRTSVVLAHTVLFDDGLLGFHVSNLFL